MDRGRARRWLNRWSRRVHRWGSIATAAPLLVVLCTGILLLLKKDVAWIQPPTAEAEAGPPVVAFEEILAAVRSVPEVGVSGWDDIDRLDVRPSDGLVKVKCAEGWEVQVCTTTGAVLQHAVRRSDLIESIHDGTWFHSRAKLAVFLPSAVLVLVLWVTGMWLWLMPHLRRGRRGGPGAGATQSAHTAKG